jgi:hypothetical protein
MRRLVAGLVVLAVGLAVGCGDEQQDDSPNPNQWYCREGIDFCTCLRGEQSTSSLLDPVPECSTWSCCMYWFRTLAGDPSECRCYEITDEECEEYIDGYYYLGEDVWRVSSCPG